MDETILLGFSDAIFTLMLPACSGSGGYSVLPRVRGCGCTMLHPLFLGFVGFFSAGTFEIIFLSRDWADFSNMPC